MATSNPLTNGATTNPTKIAVFCGASEGEKPIYMQGAKELGEAMGRQNIHLVYGGGTVGLMGQIASTVVANSSTTHEAVHGIIPTPLVRYERAPEFGSAGHSSTGIPAVEKYGHTSQVSNMHKRKQMMTIEIMNGGPGSGFIAMPGGFGTLEELCEIITWNQLGIHDLGVVLLNVGGFWEPFKDMINSIVTAGFIREGARDIVLMADTAEEAIEMLKNYKPAPGRLNLTWEDLAAPPADEIISTKNQSV